MFHSQFIIFLFFLVVGMSVGLASLYLTELPQKEIRGAIGSFHQLAVTVGILLAQIIGLKEILGIQPKRYFS